MPSVPPPAPSSASAPAVSDVAAEAGMPAYRVQLPAFEGPLDLLLHLIEEHELDIRDIPIAFVAQKYVEYITLMDQLNIDVASEYLVMAATLAHIKSKMLLPAVPADQDEEDEAELDPRAELVRRLLEYQKYKHAAEQLGSSALLGRDVFARGMAAPNVDGPAPLAGMSLFKLLDAFQTVLSRAKATVDHQIDFERFSITDRINEISDLLRRHPKLPFDELFQGQRTRFDLIITFLALLEMTKLRLTRLYQEGPLEIIVVELAVSDELASDQGPGDDLEARGPMDELDRAAARNALHAEEPDYDELDAEDPDDDVRDELDAEEPDDVRDELDAEEPDDVRDELDVEEPADDSRNELDAEDPDEAARGALDPIDDPINAPEASEQEGGVTADPSRASERAERQLEPASSSRREGSERSEGEERGEDDGEPDDALDFETER